MQCFDIHEPTYIKMHIPIFQFTLDREAKSLCNPPPSSFDALFIHSTLRRNLDDTSQSYFGIQRHFFKVI